MTNTLKISTEFTTATVEQMFNGDVSACLKKIADYSAKLLPEEKKLVETVVQKRLDEFSTGRLCAHRAMHKLNLNDTPQPLLSGQKREPLWPNSLIGSISHSAESCVAVVSADPAIESLGIDIEKREGIKPGVRDLICSQKELSLLGEYQYNPEAWKLIFSAKESVYKALFPILEKWIGFSHATLEFDFEQQRFRAEMDPALGLPERIGNAILGRYSVSAGYILTVVEVPARP